jgi:NADPH:quinone reductase-like Zn-dependent oxidoreductase
LGHMPRFIGLVLKALLDPEKRKTFKFPEKAVTMEIFRDLLATGKLTPVVGRTFGLEEVVAAMRCMQEGTLIGRAILVP